MGVAGRQTHYANDFGLPSMSSTGCLVASSSASSRRRTVWAGSRLDTCLAPTPYLEEAHKGRKALAAVSMRK